MIVYHVVEFREDGWALEHPTDDEYRRDGKSLLDCPCHLALREDIDINGGAPVPPGRYKLYWNEAQIIDYASLE